MVLRFSEKEYNNLFGSSLDKKKDKFPEYKAKKNTRKNNIPLESAEQVDVIRFCSDNDIRFFAVPNANVLSFLNRNIAMRTMNKLKAEGLSPGVPDLVFPIVTSKYPGLYIEMKRISGGKVSDDQEEWLEYLTGQGYMAVVCKGHVEAIKTIKKYLNT